MNRLAKSWGIFLLCAWPRSVAAHDARSAQANALLLRGEALLQVGQRRAACSAFEASESRQDSADTLLHLADCYERAGRTASAWHAFLEAEAVAQSKGELANVRAAAARVAELQPRLQRIVFVVPKASCLPGLSLRLDRNTLSLASSSKGIPVDPGAHHVTAFATGYRPWGVELEVARDKPREFRVLVPPLKPLPEPVTHVNHRHAIRTVGIVTGGAGIAGIGAGALFGALAKGTRAERPCRPGAPSCLSTKPNSSSSSYSEASALSLAVGSALLASGLTLFVLAPAPDNRADHALRVAARPTYSGGRLQLEGVW